MSNGLCPGRDEVLQVIHQLFQKEKEVFPSKWDTLVFTYGVTLTKSKEKLKEERENG